MGERCTFLRGFTGFSARSVNAEKFGVQLKRPGLIGSSLRPDLRDVQLWDLLVPELGIVMQHGSRSRAVARDGCDGSKRFLRKQQSSQGEGEHSFQLDCSGLACNVDAGS